MTLKLMVFVWTAGLALAAGAQPAPDTAAERPSAELEYAEAQLDAARARLEAAARDVARLSAQLAGPEVKEIVRRIRVGGRRAMLGVSIEDAEGGVLVAGVTPGGPAAEAGVASGDVIIRINGVDVSGADSVRRLMQEMRNVEPGDQVPLVVQRGGRQQTLDVTAREFSARQYAFAYGGDEDHDVIVQGGPDVDFSLGGPGWPRMLRLGRWADMELVELTPALGRYFGTTEGLLVVRAPKDPALQLQDGDVILRIGDRKPRDTGHAMRILRSFEQGETLTLDIKRDQRQRTLTLQIGPENKVSRRAH